MVDAQNSPNPLPPAELVGKRLDENRLFEARFLFQKFSSAIDPPVRRKMVQQLATRISRAEKTFAEAELLEQAGDFEKATKVYAKVYGMAIDYPSLAEARKRVEVAIKLGPLQTVEPPEQKAADLEPPPPVTLTESSGLPVAWVSFFQQRKVVLLLTSALLTTLGLVSVLFFVRPERKPVIVRPAVQSVSESNTKVNKGAVSGPEAKIIRQKKGGEKRRETGVALENNSPSPALIPPEKTVTEQEQPVKAQKKRSLTLTSDLPISDLLKEPVTVPAEMETSITHPAHKSQQKTALTGKVVQEQKSYSQSLRPAVSEISTRKKATPHPPDEKAGQQATQNISPEPELSEQAAENSGKRISEPVSTSETPKTYTVQRGDTLETIADKVYGNRYKWSYLVSANQEKLGRPPYVLTVGVQLQVPSLALLESEKTASLNDDGTYTVQSGDSLGSIALKLYGTSRKWNTLYDLNRDQLLTPGSLQVGQKLQVNKDLPVTNEKNLIRE